MHGCSILGNGVLLKVYACCLRCIVQLVDALVAALVFSGRNTQEYSPLGLPV